MVAGGVEISLQLRVPPLECWKISLGDLAGSTDLKGAQGAQKISWELKDAQRGLAVATFFFVNWQLRDQSNLFVIINHY